jgi:two-component system, NarL family, nitrate/nitrite response regulator NarL
MPITLLLVEDAPLIRRALREIIERESALLLLGEATNFAEAIRMAEELEPRVILLDLHMPDSAQFEPAHVRAQLLRHSRHIIAMSAWSDKGSEQLSRSFGADQLLDKNTLGETLLPAIFRLQ